MNIKNTKKNILGIVSPHFKRKLKKIVNRAIWVVSPTYRSNVRIENKMGYLLDAYTNSRETETQLLELQNQISDLQNQLSLQTQIISNNQTFQADTAMHILKKQWSSSEKLENDISRIAKEVKGFYNK